jgi:hypothetical protein
VAYTGSRPESFPLDTVPAGWEVQSSNLGGLMLAPRGSRNQDGTDWTGRIGIQLSSDIDPDLSGSMLRVQGHPAVVTKSSSGSSTLFVKQNHGYLVIQAWKNLCWDADRLVEFGQGVTVPDAARNVGG